ncbi:hypothetical protein [Zobellella maritima]|uniref:hypothetical protein n=1 Tax=Zobellella maritima TaxID=2059725 RepID=UPI000E30A921|nr:hypothetical protein [Zobellella maritima]
MQAHRPFAPGPLGYVAAAGLALPVAAVAWFEAVYLCFGLTGENPSTTFRYTAAVAAIGLALGWPLHGAARPAEVVRRGCQLGLLVSLLLPVVAMAVLLLWQSASDRPDLGMGGLILYNLPVVTFGVATILAIAFKIGSQLAGRRLQSTNESEKSQ